MNDGMFQSKRPLSKWGYGSFAGLGLLLGKHWLGEAWLGGRARVINERGEEASNEQFRFTTSPSHSCDLFDDLQTDSRLTV